MLGLKLPLNIFTSNLGWWSGVHFEQVCRRNQTGKNDRRQGWYSGGPQQSGERGRQEPHEAQRQMQRPVLGTGCTLQDGLVASWPEST